MFTLCLQRDTIRVEARDFGKDPVDALREEINRRYANKVIPEVGLCLSLLDIVDSSEGAVLYGDGSFYYKTEFRLIVFRPHIGEAFLGKVQSSSEAGLRVSIGFFDDIIVPPNLLPEYSVFDASERAFFWVPPPDPPPANPPSSADLLATSTEERLYIRRKDWVRIRVEEELWENSSPGTGMKPAIADAPVANGGPAAPPPADLILPPFRLICSMTESGTGVLDWWDESDEVVED